MDSQDQPSGLRAGSGAFRIDTHANTHSATPGIDAYPLAFTGSGGEFFRLWLVNLLLNIVTFGLYTPFARRRTAQYFYGHTLVAESPLEFVAQQKRMLIGFLMLAGLYIAFQVASETGQDTTVMLFLLGGAALAPYFWASAMRFRLGATRWRGIRLQFTARWSEVYRASWPVFVIAVAWAGVVFLAGAMLGGAEAAAGADAGQGLSRAALRQAAPVLAGAVLVAMVASFLCMVRLEFNYQSLLVARARIGGQSGRWKPVYADFLRIWAATFGVLLLSLLAVAVLVAVLFGGGIVLVASLREGAGLFRVMAIAALVLALVFVLFLASAPARAYRQARMFRLVWNSVGVSRIARFRCRLNTRRFVLLRLRNLLLMLLTLGFWRPFALVSEYRMRVESVTLHVKGGLDQLAGQLVREEQGLGDALADAVGLDLVG